MRIAAWLSILLLSMACVDDDDQQDGGVTLTSDAGSRTTPPPPALGLQLDRVGRPFVGSLLPEAPDASSGFSLSQAWNEEDDPLLWERFAPELQTALGLFDGLDGTCGQLDPAIRVGRFDNLAELLADDRLFVDTRISTCEQLLAVESETLGLGPVFDCGGRTPVVDAADAMLSLFTSGGRTPASDGVGEDSDGPASTVIFPFLRPPVR